MRRVSRIVGWILLGPACGILPAPVRAAAEPGFHALFNGTDLTGWEGDPRFWSVEDGAITGRTTPSNPTEKNTFLIWRQGTLEDFELRLSYRLVGGNSGVQYRSRDLGNWVVGGYQADIEAGKTFTGILYEERGRKILARRGERTRVDPTGTVVVLGSLGDPDALQGAVRAEAWNDYVITARGNRLTHAINGRPMAEVTDDQSDKSAESGILALQLHAGVPMLVQFKDIRLKRLPAAGRKRIVIVAGTPSHAPGDHEFNAGTTLLEGWLDRVSRVQASLYRGGWPADPSAFDAADAVVLYMDGGDRHPLVQGERLGRIDALMRAGVGLACLHYAVEVPRARGGAELLRWLGGYYETGYSTNPHWVAEFKTLPEHPITRGVRPFALQDEWYFNLRFAPGGSGGLTPILRATPPDSVRKTAAAREHPGREEVVAWALERPDHGRAFGFTGGHTHRNWGDENFRRLVLNAIVWIAGGEVPPEGVSSSVSDEELGRNLDAKPVK